MGASTYILGISAFYHDAAAALVRDGEIVAAAQEERFTRKRHDADFPLRAIEYCLAEAGISYADLDYVSFYDKPVKKFDRILETYFAYAPRGIRSFQMALPVWLKQKLFTRREIRRGLGKRYQGPIIFTEHHQSHAASAFFPSPFDEAAILTSDGVGEWATTTWGVGQGNTIKMERAISFPHSLGLLYSAFTYFTGFKVNSGEYKLMGLAPYGRPIFADRILEHLIDLKDDGSFRLNMDYFNYCYDLRMTGQKFEALFERPTRTGESRITQSDMDIAASIQRVTEDVMLNTARHIHTETGHKNLCLAGGVALNCVSNGRLIRESPFERIWPQPAAGDAGGALGTALFVWHQLLDNPRDPHGRDSQKGSLLGPEYGSDEIEAALQTHGLNYTRLSEGALLEATAKELEAGSVVGWFHGRMEFGPRALGSRSIIGDPRNTEMQSKMNLKIKHRESFRPFAPAVLQENIHEYFEVAENFETPYMMVVAPVRDTLRKKLTTEEQDRSCSDDLTVRVNVPRSALPAVTHVDYSARLQSIDETRHGRFYRLMRTFKERTGCPVLVNTSFNVRGEPIVNTPDEAINCFTNTEMDVLVAGDHIVIRSNQRSGFDQATRKSYLQQFALD